MNKPAAVIFDMDGLLIDSERLGIEAIHAAGLRQNTDIPKEIIGRCIGITAQASSKLYHGYYPHLDTDRLFHDFHAFMHQAAREGRIPLKKGALPLLQYLKDQSIPRAVASSSSMETIRLFLDSVGITGYFDRLITAVGLPSKPDAAVFLLAAKELGAVPGNCLVLEDSYNGVKAGRAAGMQVIMVPDVLPFSEALAPYVDHVMGDLGQVMEWMKK